MLGELQVADLAALAHDWRNFWARPKQVPPATEWISWGNLTGRGFGKTRSVSEFVNDEVRAGRATLIALGAQDEANSVSIQVLGPSGLVATAPPWFKPVWHASAMELVWPNGAKAYVRTPEVPGKIRGLEYYLSWITELQSWPASTREEAYDNFRISTRLGYARIVWDATPKKRHPVLLRLLEDAERDPHRHLVVRGTTHENTANLGRGYVEELERKYGGTQRGREELLGEMLEETDNAIAHQDWIDANRRPMPDRLIRTGIGIDPAVTSKKSSDRTGIIVAGLGVDGHAYVLEDRSGKHEAPQWAAIVLDVYVERRCDVVIVETNKGGALLTQNLRAAARERSLNVVVIGENERPAHVPGTIYVKEVYSKGEKADRARPLSTAYERGRVHHVIGADLVSLEETLTTWEPTPGARSPDDLDAETHIVGELLGLRHEEVDPTVGFKGIARMGNALERGPRRGSLSTVLGGTGGGRI